jgi:hypothetical protein
MINADPDNPEVEISVKDAGIGIDPQYHELVFEKFYQTGEVLLHSSGKTKFKGGGPGLGLAIARGIVNAHHGRIWLESPEHNEKTNPGTTVFVRLPLNGNTDASVNTKDVTGSSYFSSFCSSLCILLPVDGRPLLQAGRWIPVWIRTSTRTAISSRAGRVASLNRSIRRSSQILHGLMSS